MKIVEIRRHSKRDAEGNLSREGKALCAKAGKTLETGYTVFISSSKPRAIQTLQAFGAAEHKVDDRFTALPGNKIARYEKKAEKKAKKKSLTLLQSYFKVKEIKRVLRKVGKDVLAAIQDVARNLSEDGKALIVSHGGTIEPAVLAAIGGDFSLKAMGGEELKECEGAKFYFESDRLARVDVIRLL